MRTHLFLGAVLSATGCTDAAPATDAGTTDAATTNPGTTGDTTATGGGTEPAGTDGGTTMGAADSSTGDDVAEGTTGEPVEPVLHGACDLADRVGAFSLLREADYTTFSGSVADGVVPIAVLENVGEGSGCTLLRRNNPFCDPACSPNETCDFDGTCVPYPTNHDVGVIDVTGLVQAVMLEPLMPTYEYYDTTLMHPAYEADAAIHLSATGGDYAAFDLYGVGVAMIEPGDAPLVLDPSAPLEVTWTPGDGPGTVRVELNVDQHGLTPVKLVCTSEDTGSISVPAPLIEAFTAFGITGFPSANFYRETVDSVDLAPGCVEFGVRAHRQSALSVVGHTPCSVPNDCPKGLVCDLMIQTCV